MNRGNVRECRGKAVALPCHPFVCVDTHRTFAMGFSNGGYVTYRLACERASRFAAVAPVSGPFTPGKRQ